MRRQTYGYLPSLSRVHWENQNMGVVEAPILSLFKAFTVECESSQQAVWRVWQRYIYQYAEKDVRTS